MSADINCGLNCSSPSDPRVAAVCGVIGAVSGCNVDDVAKKRWLRMYWGSDDQCNEGFWPKEWPGIMEQVLCCDASEKAGCNAPGSAAPTVRCFGTASFFWSGSCSGRTANYSVCAVSQDHADQEAASASSVSFHLLGGPPKAMGTEIVSAQEESRASQL